MPEVLLTGSEAARRLGIPRNTINGWRYRGELKAVGQRGASPLYRLADLEAIPRRNVGRPRSSMCRRGLHPLEGDNVKLVVGADRTRRLCVACLRA